LPVRFARQPRLRVSGRLVGLIASLLPAKVHRPINGIILSRSSLQLVFGTETLLARRPFCPPC
jgi:hypothetical protein